MNNTPPEGPPKVNPPLEATEAPKEVTPTVNPPMDATPQSDDPKNWPPAVSSEKIKEMVEAGFRENRADYESDEVDLSGAGPQPLDDSAFGSDD